MSDDPERVRFVDTAIVEGAVASSVRARSATRPRQSPKAGRHARTTRPPRRRNPVAACQRGSGEPRPRQTTYAERRRRCGSRRPARAPAAAFRLAETFDAEITVNGVDATSMLSTDTKRARYQD